MSSAFEVGMTHEITVDTKPEHTAQYFYENLPDVFATPFLGGFMERVSAELINKHLQPGEQSVGISITLQHSAATPIGMQVRIRTEISAVDGARLTFKLEAWDEQEKIGEAVHERFIIKAEKFNARVAKKAAPAD
ncbi:MAG: thioesterase family protein [Deltaproteobacteria bacterium]|nr:thioesterase family protein [Deltaproteobacteria bacterium]